MMIIYKFILILMLLFLRNNNVSSVLYATDYPFGWCGYSQSMLHLSFDDGPNHVTMQLLDSLDVLNVKASFYVLGKQARIYPHIIQEIVIRGHMLASHAFTHKSLSTLTIAEINKELDDTKAILEDIVGNNWQMTLFRPPYGELLQTTYNDMVNSNITVVSWGLDTKDYQTVNKTDDDASNMLAYVSTIEDSYEARLGVKMSSSILLGHDQYQYEPVISNLVNHFRNRGYTFVSYNECKAQYDLDNKKATPCVPDCTQQITEYVCPDSTPYPQCHYNDCDPGCGFNTTSACDNVISCNDPGSCTIATVRAACEANNLICGESPSCPGLYCGDCGHGTCSNDQKSCIPHPVSNLSTRVSLTECLPDDTVQFEVENMPSIKVNVTVLASWIGGFGASMTVINTGSSTINNVVLGWEEDLWFPNALTDVWVGHPWCRYDAPLYDTHPDLKSILLRYGSSSWTIQPYDVIDFGNMQFQTESGACIPTKFKLIFHQVDLGTCTLSTQPTASPTPAPTPSPTSFTPSPTPACGGCGEHGDCISNQCVCLDFFTGSYCEMYPAEAFVKLRILNYDLITKPSNFESDVISDIETVLNLPNTTNQIRVLNLVEGSIILDVGIKSPCETTTGCTSSDTRTSLMLADLLTAMAKNSTSALFDNGMKVVNNVDVNFDGTVKQEEKSSFKITTTYIIILIAIGVLACIVLFRKICNKPNSDLKSYTSGRRSRKRDALSQLLKNKKRRDEEEDDDIESNRVTFKKSSSMQDFQDQNVDRLMKIAAQVTPRPILRNKSVEYKPSRRLSIASLHCELFPNEPAKTHEELCTLDVNTIIRKLGSLDRNFIRLIHRYDVKRNKGWQDKEERDSKIEDYVQLRRLLIEQLPTHMQQEFIDNAPEIPDYLASPEANGESIELIDASKFNSMNGEGSDTNSDHREHGLVNKIKNPPRAYPQSKSNSPKSSPVRGRSRNASRANSRKSSPVRGRSRNASRANSRKSSPVRGRSSSDDVNLQLRSSNKFVMYDLDQEEKQNPALRKANRASVNKSSSIREKPVASRKNRNRNTREQRRKRMNPTRAKLNDSKLLKNSRQSHDSEYDTSDSELILNDSSD